MLLEQSPLFECMLKKKIKRQVRDFTGFKIDTIHSAVFSWIKKKKRQKWRQSYREITKLFVHTTVKCVREL